MRWLLLGAVALTVAIAAPASEADFEDQYGAEATQIAGGLKTFSNALSGLDSTFELSRHVSNGALEPDGGDDLRLSSIFAESLGAQLEEAMGTVDSLHDLEAALTFDETYGTIRVQTASSIRAEPDTSGAFDVELGVDVSRSTTTPLRIEHPSLTVGGGALQTSFRLASGDVTTEGIEKLHFRFDPAAPEGQRLALVTQGGEATLAEAQIAAQADFDADPFQIPFGFANARVQGDAAASARLRAAIVDPDRSGQITESEWVSTAAGDLFSFACVASTAALDLDLDLAPVVGGREIGGLDDVATVDLNDTDVCDGLDQPNVELRSLADFRNITPEDFLNAVAQVSSALAASESLGVPQLPFVEERFADVVELNRQLRAFLQEIGAWDGTEPMRIELKPEHLDPASPKALTTIQKVAPKLAAALGVSVEQLNLRYVGRSLRFDIDVARSPGAKTLSADVGDLLREAGISAVNSAAASATATPSFALKFGVGVDLRPATAGEAANILDRTFLVTDGAGPEITADLPIRADLDLSASIGFLAVAVRDQVVAGDVEVLARRNPQRPMLTIDLADGPDNDGRLTVQELFTLVGNGNLAALVENPNTIFNAAVPLVGLEAEAKLPGGTVLARCGLDLQWADVTMAWPSVSFPDSCFDEKLLAFDFGLDDPKVLFGHIMNALALAADELDKLADRPEGARLREELPIIGRSFKDVVTQFRALKQSADAFAANPSASLQLLQRRLQAASAEALGVEPAAETGDACTDAVDGDGDGFVNDGCPAVGNRELGDACADARDENAISPTGNGELDTVDGAPTTDRVNDGCPQMANGQSLIRIELKPQTDDRGAQLIFRLGFGVCGQPHHGAPAPEYCTVVAPATVPFSLDTSELGGLVQGEGGLNLYYEARAGLNFGVELPKLKPGGPAKLEEHPAAIELRAKLAELHQCVSDHGADDPQCALDPKPYLDRLRNEFVRPRVEHAKNSSATWDERKEAAQLAIGVERQYQLLGVSNEADLMADVVTILEAAYDFNVKPALEAAKRDGTNARQTVTWALGWMRQVLLLGSAEDDPRVTEASALIADIVATHTAAAEAPRNVAELPKFELPKVDGAPKLFLLDSTNVTLAADVFADAAFEATFGPLGVGVGTDTPAPETGTHCGANTVDDDQDGVVNDGCPTVGEAAEAEIGCLDASDNDLDGAVNDGCASRADKAFAQLKAQFALDNDIGEAGREDAVHFSSPADLGAFLRGMVPSSFSVRPPSQVSCPGVTGLHDGCATLPIYFGGEKLCRVDFTAGDLQAPNTWAFDGLDGCARAVSALPLDWELILEGVSALSTTLEQSLRGASYNAKVPILGEQLDAGADIVAGFNNGVVTPLRGLAGRLDGKGSFGAISAEISSFVAANVPLLVDRTGADVEVFGVCDDNKQATAPTGDGATGQTRCLTAPTENTGDDFSATGHAVGDIVDIQVRLSVGQALPGAELDQFDIGFPGLRLTTAEELRLGVDWRLDLAFGIDRQKGFYLATDQLGTEAAAELRLGAHLDLPDSFAGELAVVRVDLADNTTAPDLDFGLEVDVKGGTGSGTIHEEDGTQTEQRRLQLVELLNGRDPATQLDVTVDGGVHLDLQIETVPQIPGMTNSPGSLPSLRVRHFVLDWGWDAKPLTGFGQSDSQLVIALNGVELGLGKWVTDVVRPMLAEIQKYTRPLQPVIDAVTTPIPVVSEVMQLAGKDPVTILSILEAQQSLNGQPGSLDMIKRLIFLIRFVNGMNAELSEPNLYVPLGDFPIVQDAARAGLAPTQVEALVPTNATAQPVLAELNRVGTGLREQVEQARGAQGGFSFPAFQDPKQLVYFLLGKEVTLAQYDTGTMAKEVAWSAKFGPPIGPWPASIGVSATFGVQGRFVIGYDTAGIREAFRISTDGDASNDDILRVAPLLFQGVFVADVDAQGNDIPEISMRASAVLSAKVIDLIVASAGIEGGLYGNLDLNLHDGLGNPPKQGTIDGKLKIDEIASRIANPICLFDTLGKIEARARLFAQVDAGIFGRYTLFEHVLGSGTVLSLEGLTSFCFQPQPPGPPVQPVLAQVVADTLVLNVGPRAAERKVATEAKDETVLVRQLNAAGTQFSVTTNGLSQEISHSSRVQVFADAGDGSDRIELLPGAGPVQFDVPAVVCGGPGADTIVGSDAADTLVGDGGQASADGFACSSAESPVDGNDSVAGGGGADSIHGGGGVDLIRGEDGNDAALDGGSGNDSVSGGAGIDAIAGAGGDDALSGGPEFEPTADTILGGAGNDAINGETGADELHGGEGVDQLRGTTGDDRVFGDAGNDLLVGAEGADLLDGGAGEDDLLGEAGDDTLRGGDDADSLVGGLDAGGEQGDVVEGGAGDDWLLGDEGQVRRTPSGRAETLMGTHAGRDVLRGDAGADRLWGQDGRDAVQGGDGPDVLLGAAGDDSLEGGAGNDDLQGEDGLDSMDGGSEADSMRGGPLRDVMQGGSGNDSLYGDSGADQLSGGEGFDTMRGGMDADVLSGEGGGDLLFGEAEPDDLRGGDGNDTIHGDAGDDDVAAGADDDTVYGEEGRDDLVGGGGEDTIYGADGALGTASEGDEDLILGDDGTIAAGTRAVELAAGGARDTIAGEEGTDRVYGGGGGDSIHGNTGDDFVEGNAGGDTIDGDAGQDDLVGGTTGAGESDGNDTIRGGAAFDVVLGDNGTIVRPTDASGAWVQQTFAPGVERRVTLHDVATVMNRDAGSGSSGDDHLYGDQADDLVFGQGGDDEAHGGDGQDAVEGNAGDDSVFGESGADDLIGGGSAADGVVDGDRVGKSLLDGADTIHGDDETAPAQDGDVIAGDNARIARPLAAGQWIADPNRGGEPTRDVQLFDVEVVGGSVVDPATSGADRIFASGGADRAFGQGNGPAADADGDGRRGEDPSDGIDNDRDGREGPASAEYDCADGRDGDGDGAVDAADPQCDAKVDEDGRGDELHGGGGIDHLEGNHGSDHLLGDSSEDDLVGGSSAGNGHVGGDVAATNLADGDDVIGGNLEDDVAIGDNGVISRPTGADGLWRRLAGGNGFNLAVREVSMATGQEEAGAFGNDWLAGNDGHDDLYGQAGGDYAEGNMGEDALLGDLGRVRNNVLGDGVGTDPAPQTIRSNPGHLEETIFETGTLLRETELYAPGSVETGTQTSGGDGGPDTLLGGEGADSIHAGPSVDLANGGGGGDAVFGGDGDDAVWGGADRDHVYGGHGADYGDVEPRPAIDGAPRDSALWFTFGTGSFLGLDVVYGGWGPDAIQANSDGPTTTTGDRLIDWSGAFNVYFICGNNKDEGRVVRSPSPHVQQYLVDQAAGDGAADPGTAGSSGYRELAIVQTEDRSYNSHPKHPDHPGHHTCGLTDETAPPPTTPVATDLSVAPASMSAGSGPVVTDDRVPLSAAVHNSGSVPVLNVAVRFAGGGVVIGKASVDVPAGGSSVATVEWDTGQLTGDVEIDVRVDPADAVGEADEDNNVASRVIAVAPNLVANGSFEESTRGVAPDGWTATGAATWVESGARGARSVALADAASAWTSSPIAIAPGRPYALSFAVVGDGAAVTVEHLGPDGSVIATTAPTLEVGTGSPYVPRRAVVVSPEEATHARLVFTAAVPVRIDDVKLWS